MTLPGTQQRAPNVDFRFNGISNTTVAVAIFPSIL